MEIFELATRQKFRFSSVKGELTVEQLWDLPLQARSGADLDTVAKGIAVELRGLSEESFVNPATIILTDLETKLELVKHIIAVRLAENEAKRTVAAKAAEKAKLLEILADKQDSNLRTLSEDEIKARIAAL